MGNFNNYIVNCKNLKNNYAYLKNEVGKNVKVCAMVKANGYGHGVKDVCLALHDADFFGVASAFEAYEIREFDKVTPILIVSVLKLECVKWCSYNNVSITISSLSELKKVSLLLNNLPIKVHIKINSGLNRIGVKSISEFKNMLKFMNNYANIHLEGVFTHFATKLHDLNFILTQHNTFKKFIKFIKNKNVIIHCCNSFATVMFKDLHYQMVRCGFSLYGWQLDVGLPIKPVLKITTKIIFINDIKKGESVGYDRGFIAKENCKIGVLPIGYADGLDRRLSNNFSVLINGKKADIVGNICMDSCMINLNNACDVNLGDEVILLGESGDLSITPSTYAKALNTSEYEVLLKFRYCRMNRIIIK